jgi:hypothetical protein
MLLCQFSEATTCNAAVAGAALAVCQANTHLQVGGVEPKGRSAEHLFTHACFSHD